MGTEFRGLGGLQGLRRQPWSCKWLYRLPRQYRIVLIVTTLEAHRRAYIVLHDGVAAGESSFLTVAQPCSWFRCQRVGVHAGKILASVPGLLTDSGTRLTKVGNWAAVPAFWAEIDVFGKVSNAFAPRFGQRSDT